MVQIWPVYGLCITSRAPELRPKEIETCEIHDASSETKINYGQPRG